MTIPGQETLTSSPTRECPTEPQTEQKTKRKKKKKANKTSSTDSSARNDPQRPPVLCISRNKHWKYISSYHVSLVSFSLAFLVMFLLGSVAPTSPRAARVPSHAQPRPFRPLPHQNTLPITVLPQPTFPPPRTSSSSRNRQSSRPHATRLAPSHHKHFTILYQRLGPAPLAHIRKANAAPH